MAAVRVQRGMSFLGGGAHAVASVNLHRGQLCSALARIHGADQRSRVIECAGGCGGVVQEQYVDEVHGRVLRGEWLQYTDALVSRLDLRHSL